MGCPTCPKILGIAPLVPIVPDLISDVHRQWQSYDGFTFAFSDYTALNLTQALDSDIFANAMKVVDPIYYGESLARLPKVVVLSSDDEFMQFDWSDIWYSKLTGEKHLLIAPNSEHSLASGIPEILDTMTAMIKSIAEGHGESNRPNFDYSYDPSNGEITVTIPPGLEHGKVVLRHAQTISTERSNFRWIRSANNNSQPCKLPEIKLKNEVFGGGNCVVPIIWLGKTLDPVSPGVYKATPPEPKEGHWTGYYVEVYFPSDTEVRPEYQFTTPGWAWPNTLPFKDCHAETCIGRL